MFSIPALSLLWHILRPLGLIIPEMIIRRTFQGLLIQKVLVISTVDTGVNKYLFSEYLNPALVRQNTIGLSRLCCTNGKFHVKWKGMYTVLC